MAEEAKNAGAEALPTKDIAEETLVMVENAETPAPTATGGGWWLTRRLGAARRLASVTSWENSKIAEMEAELKKIHEQLEMKKSAQAEKLKNSAAAVHRAAEEKRAAAVARRGEEVIAAEEAAARYRARGQAPTRLFGRG
ncbi:unnamed protein product [Miscanthus lutarioriparius]|uniref:Remorin C-terminal domain-containing protein n=1 Tax=Miscanthus lutarioriparius TaxID=422564 RepID=A0A811MJS7_9POAL|nr:unnamed protein product [Miscanthus lutarioriparius]